jgi:hypothetical protein
VQTDLVEYMIMGYNREDVRSCCDVCTVGWVVWVVSPEYSHSHYGAHEPYMTNLPSRVMEPEAMELSRTTFACPSWWLSNVWRRRISK